MRLAQRVTDLGVAVCTFPIMLAVFALTLLFTLYEVVGKTLTRLGGSRRW